MTIEEALARQREYEVAGGVEKKRPRLPHTSKFNEKTSDTILQALTGHQTIVAACRLARITSRTFAYWMSRGLEEHEAGQDTEFARFFLDAEFALGAAEARAVRTIVKAADRGDTRSASWLLERRHANSGWQKVEKVEHGGDPSQPIVVQLAWPGQAIQESDPHRGAIDAAVEDA